MKFKRINAHMRHLDKELTFHLDLTSVQDEGQSITAWQKTIEHITNIQMRHPEQWYLSYFVAMEVTQEKAQNDETNRQ